jgi:hypothetical protein
MTSGAARLRVRRTRLLLGLCTLLLGTSAAAQGNDTASRARAAAHRPVCTEGVRGYTSMSLVPKPFDSLAMPPHALPVRITSPEEEMAAEREMRRRAGSVGATGLVVLDEVIDEGGMPKVRRHVVPVFVAADSARAQAVCRGAAHGDKGASTGDTAMPSKSDAP